MGINRGWGFGMRRKALTAHAGWPERFCARARVMLAAAARREVTMGFIVGELLCWGWLVEVC
jgi:hypothetical protein